MQEIVQRIGRLMSVKSIVTIVLTAVFAYLSIIGKIDQDFLTVYTVVIAFYYGTQTIKEPVKEVQE